MAVSRGRANNRLALIGRFTNLVSVEVGSDRGRWLCILHQSASLLKLLTLKENNVKFFLLVSVD